MEKLTYKELINLIINIDTYKTKSVEDVELLFNKAESTKSILGVDIYKYSQYPELSQNLIPLVFDYLVQETAIACYHWENYIFETDKKTTVEFVEEIKDNFISTGDGGFFVFDTPIHALVFAIYFEGHLKLFNSDNISPSLRSIIKHIDIRYAMTRGKIFNYEGSYYGAPIITNARILSKDRLNRFLFDKEVYAWFMQHTNGIDNLQVLTIQDLFDIGEFEAYSAINLKSNCFKNIEAPKNIVDPHLDVGFKNINIQKIGEIKAKDNEISIYNLHIQFILKHMQRGESLELARKLVVTLGNLNVSGISD